MAGKRGRPKKDSDEVRSVHFGLKVTQEEYATLLAVVEDEKSKLTSAGFEALVTTASMVRRLIREEAIRRGLTNGLLDAIPRGQTAKVVELMTEALSEAQRARLEPRIEPLYPEGETIVVSGGDEADGRQRAAVVVRTAGRKPGK